MPQAPEGLRQGEALCPIPPMNYTQRTFGFYWHATGHDRSTALLPDDDTLGAQWKAKRAAFRPVGSPLAQYENCAPPPLLHRWGTTAAGAEYFLLLLGALWAELLPFVEVLVLLSLCTPSRFQNQCISDPPKELPTCIFPSGAKTQATGYWPTPKYARRHGHPARITTIRLFCPVPPKEDLHRLTQFRLSLRHSSGAVVPLEMCQKKRTVGRLVACPQPLFNYAKMNAKHPNMVHEWLAYHQMVGFHRFMVYDIFGDFVGPLQPWVRTGFVEMFGRFVPRHLQPPRGNATVFGGREYCTEGMAHDHCLFMNQLTSHWAMLLHAPDNYLTFREPDKYPQLVHSWLAKRDPLRYAEILVLTRPCGGPPLANHSSLLLTFDQCSRALYRRRETPVFSPLLVLTTEVHICGTVHPMVANTHRTTVMDPVKVVTTHFMQMFWRKEWALAYGKPNRILYDLWPKVHAAVEAALQEGHAGQRPETGPAPDAPP